MCESNYNDWGDHVMGNQLDIEMWVRINDWDDHVGVRVVTKIGVTMWERMRTVDNYFNGQYKYEHEPMIEMTILVWEWWQLYGDHVIGNKLLRWSWYWDEWWQCSKSGWPWEWEPMIEMTSVWVVIMIGVTMWWGSNYWDDHIGVRLVIMIGVMGDHAGTND